MRQRPLTYDRAHELLRADYEAGTLTWRATRGSRAIAGTRAGCADKRGYRLVRLDGVLYKEHRVLWLMAHGEWPDDEIDHRNRTPGDNRLGNLRPATSSQNKQNRGGVKGVCWDKSRGRWLAHIKLGGKRKNLGRFDCFGQAWKARQAARAAMHDYAPAA